jgi:hypothetical protein
MKSTHAFDGDNLSLCQASAQGPYDIALGRFERTSRGIY